MQLTTPEKDLRIETIRGLALLLMVAGHVIGDVATTGMEVADDSFLRYLYNSLVYVRMPLFTAISGYVYALRPVTRDSALGRFYQGKLRRIVLPLVVVSTLFFVAQMVAPGANASPEWIDMFPIYVFGYAHFWFLQAIFCIFLIVSLLDKLGGLNSAPKALIAIALSVVASLGYDAFPKLFSFDRAVGLLPFFLLGLSIYRFWDQITSRAIQTTLLATLVITVGLDQAYLWNQTDFSSFDISVVGTALGLSAIYLLIVHRFYFKPLAWLGRYAFEIYLLHVFGTAGTRILLGKLNVNDDWIVFSACLLVGLALPVAVKRVTQHVAIADLLIFGTRRTQRRPKAQSSAAFKTSRAGSR
ncbi:acyltransferase family protein [Pseudomonas matsuisoli]|uniref:Acyltransferase 3 domain-containing protein n=1 Tax=Pseudomonas matsuisoli TaxID=1515666 RepID=A0A917PJM2_9PSED|nr:acyltransferase [Pseudomonas matsuisoli]GGJ81005.1 hypothetical protein GCM10009304_03480 [Pseudomonas matsuisoli]